MGSGKSGKVGGWRGKGGGEKRWRTQVKGHPTDIGFGNAAESIEHVHGECRV